MNPYEDDLQAAWAASEQAQTAEALDAWLMVATRYMEAGGTLPDVMAKRYQLATGAQGLPRVTVTASRMPDWVIPAGLLAVLALWGRKA